jgi:two-component SAPR family response regulator
MLGNASGIELIKYVSELNSITCIVILISAMELELLEQKEGSKLNSAYLKKPFTQKELNEKIESLRPV